MIWKNPDEWVTLPELMKMVFKSKDDSDEPVIEKTYSEGIYKGQFRNEKWHGHGTFTWNDGHSYEG